MINPYLQRYVCNECGEELELDNWDEQLGIVYIKLCKNCCEYYDDDTEEE